MVSRSQSLLFTFIDYQQVISPFQRSLETQGRYADETIQGKKLEWPARYIYIRSFKYDSQLEVWVKYETMKNIKLFKTYKVCALGGLAWPETHAGRLPGAGRILLYQRIQSQEALIIFRWG